MLFAEQQLATPPHHRPQSRHGSNNGARMASASSGVIKSRGETGPLLLRWRGGGLVLSQV